MSCRVTSSLIEQARISALFFQTLVLDGIRCLAAHSSWNANGSAVALAKLQDDIVTSFGMRTDEGVVLT